MMSDSSRIDQLIAEVARLKERVDGLEKAAYSEASVYVEGWTNAAKLLGVTNITCINRSARGEFPVPCRLETIYRKDGKKHSKPTWRRADLVAYAEGK